MHVSSRAAFGLAAARPAELVGVAQPGRTFARALAQAGVMFEIVRHEALEKACVIVEEEAKRVIGTYDYGWPQLAESTQKQRVAEGYSANDPLLRTGELRDSITHHVEGDSGSPSKIELYQELGTSKIPPRSFLCGTAMAKEHEIHELGPKAVHAALKP